MGIGALYSDMMKIKTMITQDKGRLNFLQRLKFFS